MATATDLGVSDVLDVVTNLYQIDGEVRDDEFRFLCVAHEDARPSADVNLDTGLWSCFSCGAKGDLAGLGTYVLKKTRNEVVGLLKPGAPDAVLASVQNRLQQARTKVSRNVAVASSAGRIPSPSRYASSPLTYMRSRGFTKETLRKWNVRFVASETFVREVNGEEKPFSIENNIGIPIYNANGKLVAWVYRKTDLSASWQPKVMYTPGFDLTGNWFGLHHHQNEDEVYICEGPLDAMWLDQHGYPALAMMGNNHRNPRKYRMLSDFRKVIVVPDYDKGGFAMAYRVGLSLRGNTPVDVVRWPKSIVHRTGKDAPDPQDVRRAKDIHQLLQRKISWAAWCLRNNLPMRQTE